MQNPLRAYRKKHELTQQELADILGVSRQMVGALENGEREFTAEMANTIQSKLGINRIVIRPDLFRQPETERAACT